MKNITFYKVFELPGEIMKYTDFLIYHSISPNNLRYAVSIDLREIRDCPEFREFLGKYSENDVCGETPKKLSDYFRVIDDQLFYGFTSKEWYRIDTEGYLHLKKSKEETAFMKFRSSTLSSYYGFKVKVDDEKE